MQKNKNKNKKKHNKTKTNKQYWKMIKSRANILKCKLLKATVHNVERKAGFWTILELDTIAGISFAISIFILPSETHQLTGCMFQN